MKENVTIFTKSAISFFSIWRDFGSFSNKITRKVVMENLTCYFYHVENIKLWERFFAFSPYHKNFELYRKKSQNFDFFQKKKKHIFFTFLSKI